MTRQAPTHEAGFTLVELLIGLALLALMTALMSGALSGVRQAQRSHDRRTVAASVEPAEAYLRHVLIDMRPIRQSGAPAASLIDARTDTLTFISGYSPPGGYGGLHRVTLSARATTTPNVFDLNETRALHRPNRTGDAETRTRLLTNIAGIKLSYLGMPAQGTQPIWSETWTNPVQLPQAVAIDIAFPAGDTRRWAPLIVTIPAGR
jgi:general secretion pathway protein J